MLQNRYNRKCHQDHHSQDRYRGNRHRHNHSRLGQRHRLGHYNQQSRHQSSFQASIHQIHHNLQLDPYHMCQAHYNHLGRIPKFHHHYRTRHHRQGRRPQGMNITIVTSARTNDAARDLLERFGMPFQQPSEQETNQLT